MSFITITKTEFEDFLPKDFLIVDNPDSKEIIYEIPTGNSSFSIRIYSSITHDGISRGIGEDAIRCVLMDVASDKPVDKAHRTNRVEGWKKRLQEKINELKAGIQKLKVCKCGSAMREIEGKNGKFWGCTRYPLCLNTMDANGHFKEKFNRDTEPQDGKKKIVKCPKCDGIMVKRNGKFGEFYGCVNFSKTGCKGFRKVSDVEMYGQGVEIEKADDREVKPKTKIDSGFGTKVTYDAPSNDEGIVLVETKDFPHLKFPFKFFNPVQSRVFQFYDRNINLVVAAATSAGKTVVAEMLMSESIKQGKKAIFLSPLKAVSQEKHDDWTNENHDWSKLNVSIVTGDYQLSAKRVEELNKANVIIMTTEMLDSRTRRITTEKNDWLLKVGTVVYDEAHLIQMQDRGDKTESAIMRFSKQNPDCRIVLLSATMPNVSELAKWLTFLNGKPTELINSNYRPCQLDVHHMAYYDKGRYADVEERKIFEAIKIVKQYKEDKFIVFVHSKNTGRAIFQALKAAHEQVEYFNADVDLDKRRSISETFKEKGSLRIIVSTSCLAWGINLPARRVIVVGIHRGMQEVQPLDVKQMCGRSGRVGFDPKGDAYVLLPQSKFDYYKTWCEDIPPISSTMNNQDILAFHIVSEISEGVIYDVSSLMSWYNRSLAAFQNNFLDRIDAETLLNKLEKIKIIERKNERFIITNLGRVASYLYFSPYSIAAWYFNFNNIIYNHNINDVSISWALANIPENYKSFVPKEFEEETKDFESLCKRQGLDIRGSAALTGLFFHSCLTYSQDIADINKRSVKYDFDRIAAALNMIDNMYAKWNFKEFFERLELRIQYEVTEDQTELCTLKHIGGVYTRRLFEAGIRKIRDITRNPTTQEILGDKLYAKVVLDNNL